MAYTSNEISTFSITLLNRRAAHITEVEVYNLDKRTENQILIRCLSSTLDFPITQVVSFILLTAEITKEKVLYDSPCLFFFASCS